MPNKNIKKRRRVIMTSDVVPAGSHKSASSSEATTDELSTTDAEVTTAAAAASAFAPLDEPTGDGAEVPPSSEETPVADTAQDDTTDEATVPSAPGIDPASAENGSVGDALSPVEASEQSAADEVTEPAVKGDELWSPEESESPAVTVPAADLSRAHLKGLIEALVFVADQPLALNDIAKAAGRADRKLVKALADELRQDYARRGIHLDEVAGGLIFRTNAAYAPFIRDAAAKKPVRMTRAQLETLSIIAYRQPLTRPEVDEVRGVDSGPVMKMLLERGLIKILGKKDEPGRPLLYGTTHAFLEFFGLKALKDLPSLREFTELNDDSRRVYDREMGESPDAPAEPDLATLAAAASAAGSPVRSEGSAETEIDPSTMRPQGGAGEWFERPTEPDPELEALDPLSSSAELGASDDGAKPSSDSDESDAQA